MQMKVRNYGSQALGVEHYPEVHIYLRTVEGAKHSWFFEIDHKFGLKGNSIKFQYSRFMTKWFNLDPANEAWAYNLFALQEDGMRIDIEGSNLGRSGYVIRLIHYEKGENAKVLVDRDGIQLDTGIQIMSTSVYGRMRGLRQINASELDRIL